MWLWLAPNKREAQRGVNGKVRAKETVNLDQQKEKKWDCEEELLWGYGCQTHRFCGFVHSALLSRAEGTLCELPALSHTMPVSLKIYVLQFPTQSLMHCFASKPLDHSECLGFLATRWLCHFILFFWCCTAAETSENYDTRSDQLNK